jgi:hypothetical protein
MDFDKIILNRIAFSTFLTPDNKNDAFFLVNWDPLENECSPIIVNALPIIE